MMRSHDGASQYNRKVFSELLKKTKQVGGSVHLFCLYDSKSKIVFPELSIKNLKKYKNISFVDINDGIDYVNSLECDIFFLACAQFAYHYPQLMYINSLSVIVFHDCVWEDLYNNDLNIYMTLNEEDSFRYRGVKSLGIKSYFNLKSPTWRFCRWLLISRCKGKLEEGHAYLQPAVSLVRKRSDNIVVTVSQYSGHSIAYNLDLSSKRIKVLYSPERVYNLCGEGVYVADEILRDLIKNKRKYYLIVSANRQTKNARKVLRVFEKYCELYADAIIVTVGLGCKLYEKHFDIPFLSDNDLEKAYQYCYALIYPSYFEGFGYPPLEAMKYGKPVLSSNVCSMPEILGDAPIYFSPFYESAIYGALVSLNDDNYKEFSAKAINRYNVVKSKQDKDLNELISILVNGM